MQEAVHWADQKFGKFAYKGLWEVKAWSVLIIDKTHSHDLYLKLPNTHPRSPKPYPPAQQSLRENGWCFAGQALRPSHRWCKKKTSSDGKLWESGCTTWILTLMTNRTSIKRLSEGSRAVLCMFHGQGIRFHVGWGIQRCIQDLMLFLYVLRDISSFVQCSRFYKWPFWNVNSTYFYNYFVYLEQKVVSRTIYMWQSGRY